VAVDVDGLDSQRNVTQASSATWPFGTAGLLGRLDGGEP
jgi:hypothetical protein